MCEDNSTVREGSLRPKAPGQEDQRMDENAVGPHSTNENSLRMVHRLKKSQRAKAMKLLEENTR